MEHLLELRRLAGNRAVSHVLGGSRLQPKLTINQPGDVFEQEADRIADHVMRTSEPALQRACAGCTAGAPCAECAAEQKERVIQRTPTADGGSHTTSLGILGGLGPGRPLELAVRAYFEPRFGHRFGDVRVHTGMEATEAARAVTARAFTLGRDVVFGAREYAPETMEGRRLLAHELTHVVQQRAAPPPGRPNVQRQVSPVICSPDKMLSVNVDSYRARAMLLKAAAKLAAYAASFGLAPTGVRSAMRRHFGTTLPPFAALLAQSATQMAVWTQASALATSYACRATGSWPCSPPTIRAWVPWCLPGGPIVLCDPSYFGDPDIERSATLIHEWAHKFWCRLDIGYEHEPEYPSNLFTASLNADNFANLIRDLQ